MSMLFLLFGTGYAVSRKPGVGDVITGGTFSRGRWRDILAEEERRERDRIEARRKKRCEKQEAKERERIRLAAEREAQRNAEKEHGEALALLLAHAHAEAARCGVEHLRAVADLAATQARHAPQNDDDEAISLLLLSMEHQ